MGIIIKPIVTEKLTAQGEKLNRYGFIVDRKANKLEVKTAVEQMYNVSVASVNTVNYHVVNHPAVNQADSLAGSCRANKYHCVVFTRGQAVHRLNNIRCHQRIPRD